MIPAGSTLDHIGVPYVDPEALVESVGARVSDAVDDGADVYLSVDRRTARGFRELLGDASHRVAFPSPSQWPRDFVRAVRRTVRRDRPALILGQYTALGAEIDLYGCEDGINLVLGDLPLTLLCSCASDADETLQASLRSAHPSLLIDGRVVPNPGYRAPSPSSPVAGTLWGPTTSRLEFCAPADLRRLREHVTRAAETLGLPDDVVHEAVQATHEAAVIAAGLPDPSPEHAVPCVLEVRTSAGVLHCEISGPPPPSEPDPRSDDPLRIVRMFCDGALLHDDDAARSVRVLRTPSSVA